MKQIIKNLFMWIIIIGVLIGALYGWYKVASQPTTFTAPTATTTPEVIREVEYKEKYDDLVKEITLKEEQYWKDKARLSAERQASEALAEQYAEQANQKKLEEESL